MKTSTASSALANLRMMLVQGKQHEAIELSLGLYEGYRNGDDVVLRLRIELWYGICLAIIGRAKEALTVFNRTLTEINGPDRALITADFDCCFDTVYAYVVYVDTVSFSRLVHMNALDELIDCAETLIQESGYTHWMDGVYFARSKIASQLDRPDEAVELLQNAITSLESGRGGLLSLHSVIRSLSNLYIRLERYDDAEDLLLPLVENSDVIDAERVEILTQLGRIAVEKEQFDKALDYANRANVFVPNIAVRLACNVWGLQVDAYRGLGNVELARAAAQRMREAASVLKEPAIEICALMDEIDVAIIARDFDSVRTLMPQADKLAKHLDGATEITYYQDELEKREKRFEDALSHGGTTDE